MKLTIFITAIIVGLSPLSRGANSELSSIPADSPQAASASPTVNPNYVVGVDDILEINVLRPEKIAQTVVVGPDGALSFPYIKTVHVKGLTLDQVRDVIHRRLADGYMKYPDVAVALKESRSKKFFISGDVATPGTYMTDEAMTVLRAISLGGGFSKSGSLGRGKIIRAKKGGAQQIIPFNIKNLSENGASDANLRILPGDTVIVMEDKFHVYGDVAKPGTFPIEENTTVLKAISLVGGFTKYGPSCHVKVLRPKANRFDYETIVVNVRGILDGSERASNVLVQPDDTIVVTEDKFNVYGAIQKPGTYSFDENTTVLKAISMAGGLSKFGSSSRVKILRMRKNRPGYESIKVNIKDIMSGSDPRGDVPLQPGDTVVVSEGIF